MRLKKIVKISMISAGTMLGILLLIGIFVPASILDKIGRSSSEVKIIDGKQVTETLNPATGEKVVTVTDTTTGQTTTTTVNAGGQTVSVQNSTATVGSPSTTGNPTNVTPTTPPTTVNPTTPKPQAPVVSLSISPATITAGSSATMGWSASSNPTNCTAGGGWSGTQAASGTKNIAPTGTTTYTLTCTNAGGSGNKSATLTVTPAAVVSTCGQQGGICHSADITGHATAGDCRSAINGSGGGMAAYAISSSFLTLHQPEKSITTRLCGRTYTSNLANATSRHNNGTQLGGSAYATWMNNFYIGPYN